MRLLICLIASSFIFMQCKSDKSAPTVTTETTTTTAPKQNVATTPYPSITQEKMSHLYEKCDYVDFVFYNTNFSMSQNNQASIRTTLSGVSTTVAKVLDECFPVGRLFFQIEGENIAEADLFFTEPNCLYYLFLEDGKYVAGNQLTESGYYFYQKVFTQASAQSGK